MQIKRIQSIKKLGLQESLDFEIDSKDHNFYADGTIVSNSHACGYSFLAAITIYLKFKYPQQFFLSLLKSSRFEPDSHAEITKISQELVYFGIKLLAPDLAKSKMDFSLEGGDIRYGLNSIKGVSDKTWAALEAFRVQEKPTKYDIFLAAKQSGINIGLLSSLIQAGTLSSYSTRRTRLVLEAQTFNILSDREKTIVIDRAEEYNFDVIKTIHDLVFIKDSVAADGKKVMKESRKNTFKNKYESYKAIYEKNKSNENFANYVFETKLLGYCPSVKLKDIFNEAYGSDLYDIMEIRSLSQWDSVKVAASVVEVFDSKTRKDDKKFFKLVISDDTGMYNCIFMDNKKHAKLSEYLEDHKMPEKGQIIIVEGKKGAEDVIWVDFLSILDEKIYMKLSEVE